MKYLTPDILGKYMDFLKTNPKLNPSRNEQQFTAYLYIIMSLLAISFFGFFAIKPTIDTILNLKKQYSDDQTVYQALQQKVAAIDSLKKQYVAIGSQLDSIDTAVPHNPDIGKLVRQVEKLAYARSLQVEKIDVGKIEIYPATNSNSQTYSFPFTISVKGSSANSQKFIYDLIAFDRIVDLEKITTENGTDSSKDNTDNAESFIQGRAYFQK